MLPLLLPPAALVRTVVQPTLTPEQVKARLKSALDATALKYSTTPSGLSFSILFDHPNQRQQMVYLALADSRISRLRVHTLYTRVWAGGKTPPDEAVLTTVLTQSKKLGAFYLYQDTAKNWEIRFAAQFDATDLGESTAAGEKAATTLKDLIGFVNAVGEETDLLVNGTGKDLK